MKLTKLMGLAVVVVALAAAMNALAFKQATIKNDFALSVKSTGVATIALNTVASPSPGVSSSISTGILSVTFTDILQPNGVYTYDNVFSILNNASYPVDLAVKFYNGTTEVLGSAVDIAGIPTSLPAYTTGTQPTVVNLTITTAKSLTLPVDITEMRIIATAK